MPHPTKQQVREYMERRVQERRSKEGRPPPDMKQIRRELGWELIEMDRREHERRGMK